MPKRKSFQQREGEQEQSLNIREQIILQEALSGNIKEDSFHMYIRLINKLPNPFKYFVVEPDFLSCSRSNKYARFSYQDPLQQQQFQQCCVQETPSQNNYLGNFKALNQGNRIEFRSGNDLSEESLNTMLQVCEYNMQTIFQLSKLKWSKAKKRQQFKLRNSKYLIALSLDDNSDNSSSSKYHVEEHEQTSIQQLLNNKDIQQPYQKEDQFNVNTGQTPIQFSFHGLIGYIHFRFELGDRKQPIIYLYELQINSNYQGQRFGYHLLQLLINLAHKAQISKIVLTVQSQNRKAKGWYRMLGFQLDEDSPNYISDKEQQQINRDTAHRSNSRQVSNVQNEEGNVSASNIAKDDGAGYEILYLNTSNESLNQIIPQLPSIGQ